MTYVEQSMTRFSPLITTFEYVLRQKILFSALLNTFQRFETVAYINTPTTARVSGVFPKWPLCDEGKRSPFQDIFILTINLGYENSYLLCLLSRIILKKSFLDGLHISFVKNKAAIFRPREKFEWIIVLVSMSKSPGFAWTYPKDLSLTSHALGNFFNLDTTVV